MICSRCQLDKNENDFYNDKREKDGRRSACKECEKKYNLENNKLSDNFSHGLAKCLSLHRAEQPINYPLRP